MSETRQESISALDQAENGLWTRTVRAVGRVCMRLTGKAAVKGMGAVLSAAALIGNTAGCADHPPLDSTYSVERTDPNLDPPTPRPHVGDGVPVTTTPTSAPNTWRPPISTPPAAPKLSKLVCRDMLYVSSGIVIYAPVVDSITGKPGLYPRDIRPVGEELIDKNPQPLTGPHQWYTKTGDKVSDQGIKNGHCSFIDVEIAPRRRVCLDKDNKPVCPETLVATYVPAGFDEASAPPINRLPEAALNNPNDFHQPYGSIEGLPIPGLSMPTNG